MAVLASVRNEASDLNDIVVAIYEIFMGAATTAPKTGVGWGQSVFGVCFWLDAAKLRRGMIHKWFIGYFGLCERLLRFTAIRWTSFGSKRQPEWECGSSEAAK
ncbi:MAG TPA: hypothetical protein DDZ51_22955 [Planctomycetaceae bacterium]|nr:hypothetical protein [Planctomycetaceae bacterium]